MAFLLEVEEGYRSGMVETPCQRTLSGVARDVSSGATRLPMRSLAIA